MHHGQILGYNPKSELIYKAFDDYFNHPIMTKIKNVEGQSVYMCKLYCLLSRECRYIVCVTVLDNSELKSKRKLIDLSWISIQTRTLVDNHDISVHDYQHRVSGPLQTIIERTQSTKETSTYKCDNLPLIITLLHTKPLKNQYSKNGTIITALETFETVVTFSP